MRRIKGLCLMLAVILLVGGCAVKEDFKVKIENNKSMELQITAAFDNELIDMMLSEDISGSQTKTYTDEERWKFVEDSLANGDEQAFDDLESEGFTYKRYEEGEFKGLTFVKKVNNIDDLVADDASLALDDLSNFGSDAMFVKKGEVYESAIDFSDISDDSSSYAGLDMDLTFTVELPNGSISNNATTVSEDGKVLTWDLLNLSDDTISFSFKLGTDFLPIIMGILAIVLIAIIAFVIVKGNKKNNLTENKTNETNNVQSENMNVPLESAEDNTRNTEQVIAHDNETDNRMQGNAEISNTDLDNSNVVNTDTQVENLFDDNKGQNQ